MTPDQVNRVRTSWTLVVPVGEIVAAQFYERLFMLDPSLRLLFAHVDLTTQQRKFFQTLAMVVAGVDDFSQLLPAVEALGRRHVGFGVIEAHYATVREALLWALARGLGEGFDDATRAAWAAAYDLLATVMLEAAEAQSPA